MKPKRVSSHLVGMFLCALALLSLVAAEFSWLATPAQAEESWPPYRWSRARVSARIVGHRLIVSGAGFPQRRAIVVRARRYDGDPWKSLAILNTSRRGKFSADLPLPHYLEIANSLQVCVKDKGSGRLACVTARRY